MKRLVQIELFPHPFHHLRCKLGIQRINLARFAGCQMNNQKRDHGNEKEGNDLLNDASSKKGKHAFPLPFGREFRRPVKFDPLVKVESVPTGLGGDDWSDDHLTIRPGYNPHDALVQQCRPSAYI